MKISVLVPCYNEAATIEKLLHSVIETALRPMEVIVVDDGSTDNTAQRLQSFVKQNGVSIISHTTNAGKGAALRSAIEAMSGDVAIIQDADLEYSPTDYHRLIAPIVNNEADFISGNRFTNRNKHRYRLHGFFSRFMSLLLNKFAGLAVSDPLSGLKVIRTPVLKNVNLQENRFGIEIEMLCKIAATGQVIELPIQYTPRGYRQGKKITCMDSFSVLRALWRHAG